jgi:DNA (cytosine-5)-methyltransferase 1
MDLGFDRAGMTCVGQVEIDTKARAILERHWPDVPKHDDITTAKEWASDIGLVGRVDVVCGGAPCQDLSVAGKRAGFAGERSVLVLDMVTLAAHVGSRWIVYENVPGLLSSNGGRDLAALLYHLADSGFHYIEWRTLDSQHFGVAQRRRRVFLVAGTAHPRRTPILLEREGSVGDSQEGKSSRSDITSALTGGLGSGGPDAAHACAGWLVPDRIDALAVEMKDGASGDIAPTLRARPSTTANEASGSHVAVLTSQPLPTTGGGPRLASSSTMQSVASTVTTGTGVRYDPDTESLVVT